VYFAFIANPNNVKLVTAPVARHQSNLKSITHTQTHTHTHTDIHVIFR